MTEVSLDASLDEDTTITLPGMYLRTYVYVEAVKVQNTVLSLAKALDCIHGAIVATVLV